MKRGSKKHWPYSKQGKGKTGSQPKHPATGSTSVASLKVTAKSPNWNYDIANERALDQRILTGEVRVAGRGASGIYVETFLTIGKGPFSGTQKVAWLNLSDFELVEDKGEGLLVIRISERMAIERFIINVGQR